MSNYKDNFNPNQTYSNEESKMMCSNYYIEVGRECYKYQGLKNRKNDILVYSAILAGLNTNISDTFSYTNTDIANRLAMDVREVRRSTNNLEKLELISIKRPKNNKRNIKVLKDLRYPINKTESKQLRKNVIKVYDRIFFYPMITKSMVHVYSYYLALTHIPNYPGFSTVSYKKVSEALGYSERHIINILKEMNNIGLINLRINKKRKNVKAVKLCVDFSKKQPEEFACEEQLEKESQANTKKEQLQSEEKRIYSIKDEDFLW